MPADEQFMGRAIEEAQQAAAEGEVPVGAVVVHEGRILARAHNLTEHLRDATAHAEMQALTAAMNSVGGKYLPTCTLYVTIEPCVMCAGALAWAQIGRVVYGAPDAKRGYTTFAPRALPARTAVTGGVREEECKALMQQFFKERR